MDKARGYWLEKTKCRVLPMTRKMKQLLEDIKQLSLQEKAALAHCLISGLEQESDERDSTDEAWAELAETRLLQLESGEVQGVTWEEIKKGIKDPNERTDIPPGRGN